MSGNDVTPTPFVEHQSVRLLREALATHKEEYADIWETWRHLDVKAQAMGAVAGVFLAALFSWARDLPPSFGCEERWLLALGVLLLSVSIGFAVGALQVRTVAQPPFGEETWNMIRDLLRPENRTELRERIPALLSDQIDSWQVSNREMLAQNLSKGSRITVAQWFLLAAATCVALLTVLVIFDWRLHALR